MDKTVTFLENIPAESLHLTLTNEPFFQKQHRDYWSIDNMKFNDYDFIICTGGSAVFYIDGDEIIMNEGSVLVVPPQTTFSAVHIGDEYFYAVAQHFTLTVFGDLDFFKLIKYKHSLEFSNWDYIKTVLERYRVLSSAKIKKFEHHALFNIILSNFIYDSYQSERIERSEDYAFIFQMLGYIETHYSDENILERAIELSPYSRDYSSRKFRKVVGVSPKHYIIKTRLNHARDLLLQNKTVKETAYQCGFSDELYFSRVFKKHLHLSPREFKIQNI